MQFYPAILEKEADSDFGVSFPDFPGCVGAGATAEESLRDAEAALALYIQGMIEEGHAVPAPSDIEEVATDPDVRRVALVMVAAHEPETVKRVNISIEESLLAKIDATATQRGMTRSQFLAEGARRLIQEGAA